MKKVILLGLLMFSLIGCNSDDDDNGSNPETFLEINSGSKWKYSEDENENGVVDGIIYLKFNNSIEIPYESWGSTQNSEQDVWECFEHFNFKHSDFGPVLFTEILENSSNKLAFRITLRENHYTTNILTKSGNRIKYQMIIDEMGTSGENIYYFDKTSDNINDLKVCN